MWAKTVTEAKAKWHFFNDKVILISSILTKNFLRWSICSSLELECTIMSQCTLDPALADFFIKSSVHFSLKCWGAIFGSKGHPHISKYTTMCDYVKIIWGFSRGFHLVVSFDTIQDWNLFCSFEAMNYFIYSGNGMNIRDSVIIETSKVPTGPSLSILILDQNWKENGIPLCGINRHNDTQS